MASIKTPSGFSYNIHGHNGMNGSERIPHVHVLCQGKRVSLSLLNGEYLAGEDDLGRNKSKEVQEWVLRNLSALMEEWNSKDDPNR